MTRLLKTTMTTTNSGKTSTPSARTPSRAAFIVKFGILGWGIPCALLTIAWDWFCGVPASELGVPLAIRLVLFGLVGGIAFGATMWKVSQTIRGQAASGTANSPQGT
jgi:hypothetical protein